MTAVIAVISLGGRRGPGANNFCSDSGLAGGGPDPMKLLCSARYRAGGGPAPRHASGRPLDGPATSARVNRPGTGRYRQSVFPARSWTGILGSWLSGSGLR